MLQRTTPILLAIALAVFGLYALEPYVRLYFFSATAPRAIEPRGELALFEQTSIALFERVSPSVVQVVVFQDQADPLGFRQGNSEPRAQGTGTGFVWDSAGNVVTNAHVLGKARRVAIRSASGSFVAADVIGVAANHDIAVVRAIGRGNIPSAIPIGTSANLKVGQWVFAVGNPFGLDQTLTTGVISALKRRLPTAAGFQVSFKPMPRSIRGIPAGRSLTRLDE
jgi:S1-C subfamily serine protease